MHCWGGREKIQRVIQLKMECSYAENIQPSYSIIPFDIIILLCSLCLFFRLFALLFFLFHAKSCFFLFSGILRHLNGNFCRTYRRIYGVILFFSKVILYPWDLLLLAEFQGNFYCLPRTSIYAYAFIWRFSLIHSSYFLRYCNYMTESLDRNE